MGEILQQGTLDALLPVAAPPQHVHAAASAPPAADAAAPDGPAEAEQDAADGPPQSAAVVLRSLDGLGYALASAGLPDLRAQAAPVFGGLPAFDANDDDDGFMDDVELSEAELEELQRQEEQEQAQEDGELDGAAGAVAAATGMPGGALPMASNGNAAAGPAAAAAAMASDTEIESDEEFERQLTAMRRAGLGPELPATAPAAAPSAAAAAHDRHTAALAQPPAHAAAQAAPAGDAAQLLSTSTCPELAAALQHNRQLQAQLRAMLQSVDVALATNWSRTKVLRAALAAKPADRAKAAAEAAAKVSPAGLPCLAPAGT